MISHAISLLGTHRDDSAVLTWLVWLLVPQVVAGTGVDGRRTKIPGRTGRDTLRPTRNGPASYCVAHADRRGALLVRRRRDGRWRRVAVDPAPLR